MKKKLFYIAGLGHSGSTMLDMILGTSEKVVGLGEIMDMITWDQEKLDYELNHAGCSCGQMMKDCSFWKGAGKVLVSYDNKENKYINLVNYFHHFYGEGMILLDSSKNTYPLLKHLNELYDLRIIYLIRDFRSFIYASFCRHPKSMIYYGYRWFLENKKIDYYLKKWNLNVKRVGYEELVFYPDYILQQINDFLGLHQNSLVKNAIDTNSHIVSGNIARVDQRKRAGIYYDARWMVSSRLLFLQPLFLPFFAWNRKNVYSNIVKGKINKGLRKEFIFHFFDKKERDFLSGKYN